MKQLPLAILALLILSFPAFVSAKSSKRHRAFTDFEEVFSDGLYKASKQSKGLEKVSLIPVDYYLVYASAKWSYPSRTFTPKLVRAYKKLKSKSKVSFELVFISSDKSEKDQLDYMKSYRMPWLTLKRGNNDRPEALLKALGQKTIPNLMVYDKEGKVVLASYGEEGQGSVEEALKSFMALAKDAKATEQALPALTRFEKDFANLLYKLDPKTRSFKKVSLIPVNYYLVYTAAKWCPSCREVTPKLVRAYNKLKTEKIPFELVFISSDKSEKDQLDYMRSYRMPWPALKNNGLAPMSLLKGGGGIPRIVVYDEEGKVFFAGYGKGNGKGSVEGALKKFMKMAR